MATTYVESSALVKRYVAEVGSAWVRRTVARPVHQVLYTAALTEVEGFCRKLAFLRQNLKIVFRKINDLCASTFLFSVICDRA